MNPNDKTPHCYGNGDVLRPNTAAENDCDTCIWKTMCAQACGSDDPRPDWKDTNPKDMIGCNKLPIHLWPTCATFLGCLGLLDGALKYGRTNWRHSGVKASIYFDACNRHMAAWFEGEDNDPDSGIPHLGHALACIAIIVDAGFADKLVDDRMILGGHRKAQDILTPRVKRLREKHADKSPKHYTIADVES